MEYRKMPVLLIILLIGCNHLNAAMAIVASTDTKGNELLKKAEGLPEPIKAEECIIAKDSLDSVMSYILSQDKSGKEVSGEPVWTIMKRYVLKNTCKKDMSYLIGYSIVGELTISGKLKDKVLVKELKKSKYQSTLITPDEIWDVVRKRADKVIRDWISNQDNSITLEHSSSITTDKPTLIKQKSLSDLIANKLKLNESSSNLLAAYLLLSNRTDLIDKKSLTELAIHLAKTLTPEQSKDITKIYIDWLGTDKMPSILLDKEIEWPKDKFPEGFKLFEKPAKIGISSSLAQESKTAPKTVTEVVGKYMKTMGSLIPMSLVFFEVNIPMGKEVTFDIMYSVKPNIVKTKVDLYQFTILDGTRKLWNAHPVSKVYMRTSMSYPLLSTVEFGNIFGCGGKELYPEPKEAKVMKAIYTLDHPVLGAITVLHGPTGSFMFKDEKEGNIILAIPVENWEKVFKYTMENLSRSN